MTLTCKLYQVLTSPKPLPEPIPVGRSVTVRCEGPRCANRTAPVFVSLGPSGAAWLCATCRAMKLHLLRAALPLLRKPVRR
ncbi:MAG: hypothetical protein NTAFB01_13090 [Nitrospira sp.]